MYRIIIKDLKRCFINKVLNSNNKNKNKDDLITMFLKDMQTKLKKTIKKKNNVI